MSRPVLILCLAPLALALGACGGRPHIAEDTGTAYKRAFRAQIESEPRRALASLGADEAKGIVDNHRARYHPNSSAAAGPGGPAGGGAGAGLLSPLVGGLLNAAGGGEGGEYNSGKIRLQAK